MSLTVTHAHQTVIADDGSDVGANAWNASHTITGQLYPPMVDTGVNYQTPANAFSITLGNSDWHLLLNPATPLSSGTITMCAAPQDGQQVEFSSSQSISVITVLPNAGQSAVNTPLLMFPGQGFSASYRASNTTWYFTVGESLRSLSADLNLYISTTGSDTTGTGTVANPWRTVQKAWLYTVNTINMSGFNVWCNCASPGTYTGPSGFTVKPTGEGNFIILGDSTTPANVVISNSGLGNSCIGQLSCANVIQIWVCGCTIGNGTVKATTTTGGAYLNLGEPTFGLPSKNIINGRLQGGIVDNTQDISTITWNGAGQSFAFQVCNYPVGGAQHVNTNWYFPFYNLTAAVGSIQAWLAYSGPYESIIQGSPSLSGAGSFSSPAYFMDDATRLTVDNFGTLFGTWPGTIARDSTVEEFSTGKVWTLSNGMSFGEVRRSRTTNLTLNTGQYLGNQFDNIGATGAVTFTLPVITGAPDIGAKFGFCCVPMQTLTVTAPASTVIYMGASPTSVAGNISSNTPGSYVEIEAVSTTQWLAKTITGTWAIA